VFHAALGLTAADAAGLRQRLIAAAFNGDAVPRKADAYGARYTIDFEMTHGSRRATIRSAWIVPHNESAPKLTTCYVLSNQGHDG
jgi:hypothetical protein